MFIVQGAITFPVSTIANFFDEKISPSTIFSQVSQQIYNFGNILCHCFTGFTTRHWDISDNCWEDNLAARVHSFCSNLPDIHGSDYFASYWVSH